MPTDALDCHSSGGPRNHLSEIGGADPLRHKDEDEEDEEDVNDEDDEREPAVIREPDED